MKWVAERACSGLGARAGLGLLPICLFAGCATFAPTAPLPGTTEPLVVPQAWSTGVPASAATPLAGWWQRFDDALLVSLIDDALRANTTLRAARAVLAQARATADVQAAAFLPTVGGSASAQRSRRGTDGTGSSSNNTFNAGFDASWEPDVFGALRAGVSAADADVLVSAASLGDAQVSLAAEVAINYLQLRGLQWRLVIAQQNLQSQQDTLQITQWRVQAGLLTALEVEQARAATAQTSAQIPLLQTAAAQAEHSVAVLTRRAPAALHERLAYGLGVVAGEEAGVVAGVQTPKAVAGGKLPKAVGAGTLPMPAAPADLVLAFPADTLRQRPDVRAAQARVTAASSRFSQADAARLPGFHLSGSLGLSALTLGTLTNGSSLLASVLASVSAPLLDGGAGRARVRVQQAALEGAAANYDAAVLAALKDVEDSLVALRNNRERLLALRVAADAAQNAALLARQRFSSGLVDFQVVLDTQRTVLSAQDGVASSASDVNADHVRLYKALGGGWESEPPTEALPNRVPRP